MIIEWPLNGQFHDAVTDALTSRTDVSEMVDHDHERRMALQKEVFLSTFFGKITSASELS